ncbi:hypothetical protein SODALDRAFT_27378 [Sodiomyces alkalinus F11]|uniref:HTH APSES-type domain-containing protein n=1 Tax=Sodiomyces alkalinus (strain CBS 110278 / VKM F-3762 / F11) TaxID=1314773 RepID=A0A3N2Q8J9_SODAK|nr:hypothetical protein SODALDRAFT_27378 [Sodiomyces alkalinus F11]ROT42945.1 hypothetical protein SODALDRAFT_27378 [Sodiomyces alkalinus F11]
MPAPVSVRPSIERRPLPSKHNPLMIEDIPPYGELVARRRLGQTQLTAKMVSQPEDESGSFGVFDYAHLRAPLPKGIVSGIFKSSPNSYFLMRRSHDGYVSATGMFKATFPYAEAAEEDVERKYIKSLPSTSPEETAGNIWVPPEYALILAEEYNVLPWIQALLDPAAIQVSSQSDSPAKKIQPPPRFDLHKNQPQLAPPTPTSLPRTMRTRRSASPTKMAAPRPVKTPRKRRVKSESAEDKADEPEAAAKAAAAAKAETKTKTNGVIEEDKSAEAAAEAETAVVQTMEVEAAPAAEPTEGEQGEKKEEEQKVEVEMDEEVKVDEEGRVSETKVAAVTLELPLSTAEPPSAEETARMIAEAKKMVEAAAAEAEAAVNAESSEGDDDEGAKGKRKADEITAGEEGEEEEEADAEGPRSKRAKPNVELKKRRMRTRALFGISATLAVGYVAEILLPSPNDLVSLPPLFGGVRLFC